MNKIEQRLYAEKRETEAILGRPLSPKEWAKLKELVQNEAQGRSTEDRQGEVTT